MKKITVSLAVLIALVASGQEKEIKDAFNAYEGGNKAQAQTLLQQVESTVNAKVTSIDPEAYAKYLYVKGNSLLEQGKTFEAAKAFSTLSAYEKGPVYSLRNKNTKEKAFVLSKSEADKLQTEGFSGLKETKSGTDYIQKVLPVLDKKRQEVSNKATTEYNAKNYANAADNFLEAHYLTKAAGSDDSVFKYYAAVAYHAANNNEKALELYKELINEGYTGQKTSYTAVQNGQRVGLSEEQYKLFKAASNSGFTDFQKEETPSVEADIYNYAVALLSTDKKYDEALAITEKGLSKLPNDSNLNTQAGELYYQTGQTEKYIVKLKEAVQKNPDDYISLYNLGVVYGKDAQTYDLAREYYNKVLSIKSDYAAAYLNLAALSLSPDKEIVEKMQALGSTKSDQQKYDVLLAERREMFKGALPYLEKAYGYDKKDKAIIQALKEAYRVLQMRNKLDEIRKEEAAL
ncbi:MAG: tetratricopeptide repeat protein [Flavobacteriaceae bacterium]|jgi:tetratricopeptide (TPR) repeat protein|nr:tetratricopeptide repeat protein [Flavobacteriaceae bacterium]